MSKSGEAEMRIATRRQVIDDLETGSRSTTDYLAESTKKEGSNANE